MNRLTEKVKDIVEVRSSPGLTDFLADPAATLDGYHFTDITSDLMAKWIDSVADTKPGGKGTALALAGFRGVGKSHFLAVLGAILSQPELRSRITDSHISATARRLSRRHGPVGYVRRGSEDSLLEELKIAIAQTTGANSWELSDSLPELLAYAGATASDLPFVLLIDTASDREAHVDRDDGAVLSEVAKAADANGIFIGLALDDDIAGADGMNSSIASSYSIDFLDQEHLYKIVNAYVFAKREQMRPVLHEIYESYRSSFPGFRWSEHRFLSLYPLHPAILEIAPFIRLYLHDFALLGFASEAGVKILGRPANSLIGLDEVFDSAEKQLRAVPGLKEAFEAYDSLDRSLIAQMPLMKRHEAKLILKGLFLLSFNDENIDAQDLSAAMLIMDGSKAGSSEIEATLCKFAEHLPDSISTLSTEGRATRFAFKLGRKDDLNSALAAAKVGRSEDVIRSILRRQTAEKFFDFLLSDDEATLRFESQVVWRGGIRRGEVVWPDPSHVKEDRDLMSVDWTLYVTAHDQLLGPVDPPAFQWKLGSLTEEDRETIFRFHLLQTDSEIREKFRELIPTAIHVHSIAVDKIWQRVFMVDGRFIAGQNEFTFNEEAVSSHTLSQLLTVMMSASFAEQFPEHPEFKRVLGEAEASRLTEHLFSGTRAVTPETQDLAASFAIPLGLVRETEGVYVPLAESEIAEIAVVKDAVLDPAFDGQEVIPIAEISDRMRRSPYGFTLEAQHLILAALVAQRRFEFVTSAGNRIHHRSLDLQIIWDDIVGIARPSGEGYSYERLLTWATLLTSDEGIRSATGSDAKLRASEALGKWLTEWHESAVLSRFDLLADERLNSRIWRVYASVKKTFGSVADSIEEMVENGLSLNDCLQNIADAFCDSEAEFDYKQKGLAILRKTVDSAPDRDWEYSYLVGCDAVDEVEISGARAALMERLAQGQNAQQTILDAEWQSFKDRYVGYYSSRHDQVMGGNSRKKLEAFLASDLWARFAELSTVRLFGTHQMEKASSVIREMRRLECGADVRAILETQPTCVCGFDLEKGNEANVLIASLSVIVREALTEFSHRLNENSGKLSQFMDRAKLDQIIGSSNDPAKLTIPNIQALKIATRAFVPTPDSRSTGFEKHFESLSDLLLENELGRHHEMVEVPA